VADKPDWATVNEISADIVAETAIRILASDSAAIAGAWTPIALFGPAVVFDVTTMEVAEVAPDRIWANTRGAAT
jgi:hypothetical protein